MFAKGNIYEGVRLLQLDDALHEKSVYRDVQKKRVVEGETMYSLLNYQMKHASSSRGEDVRHLVTRSGSTWEITSLFHSRFTLPILEGQPTRYSAIRFKRRRCPACCIYLFFSSRFPVITGMFAAKPPARFYTRRSPFVYGTVHNGNMIISSAQRVSFIVEQLLGFSA